MLSIMVPSAGCSAEQWESIIRAAKLRAVEGVKLVSYSEAGFITHGLLDAAGVERALRAIEPAGRDSLPAALTQAAALIGEDSDARITVLVRKKADPLMIKRAPPESDIPVAEPDPDATSVARLSALARRATVELVGVDADGSNRAGRIQAASELA